jgi:hypothetical protein
MTACNKKIVQRSNLLLAFASTIVLGFWPRPDILTYFCSFQEYLFVLKWGPFFD